MEIHILDWIIYFIILFIISYCIDDDNYLGCFFVVIYTITYIVIFTIYNWIDLFDSLNITW